MSEAGFTLSPATIDAPNLTEWFDDAELNRIASRLREGYQNDLQSRSRWRERMESAMDLATQLSKEKSWPWPGCANVSFPLITIAALQFHSRAYPATLPGTEVVRYKVWSEAPQEVERARLVGQYMSWQLLEEDTDWEELHDRMLLQLPILGCVFKKTYWSPHKGYIDTDLISPFDLVLDYNAKSLDSAARKTQILAMDSNEVWERCARGLYRDVREEGWFKAAQPSMDSTHYREDERTGMHPTGSQDFTILETHCWLDLDGDGYREPYIVVWDYGSTTVLRIVSRIARMEDIQRDAKGRIISIQAQEFFTKYTFIPSPDGGVYDLGFGVLLGPLNETVNSLINQLLDAGTLANLGGGFLGRGAKIRGGQVSFAPGQWQRVDSTGDDLRKNIMAAPVPQPSSVLFQLLSLLINYTERVGGATDTTVGMNPGQNTPAETYRTMTEQGMRVYSSIFKRVWRGMKEEFSKRYLANAMFAREREVLFRGDAGRVSPVADPHLTSESLRIQQIVAIKQSAASTPGYDIEAVEREFLRALRVEEGATLYPGPKKVPPLNNPRIMVEQIKLQGRAQEIQARQQEFGVRMLEEHRLNSAQITKLEAQAAQLIAAANGVRAGHEIAAFEAAIAARKAHGDQILSLLQAMTAQTPPQPQEGVQNDGTGSEVPGGSPPVARPSGNEVPDACVQA